jgi:hypothetical protein
MPIEDTVTATTRTAPIALVTAANKGIAFEIARQHSNNSAIGSRGSFLENFGAELTEAAYPVMLRHGAIDNWLDLQLELWTVLKDVAKKWDQEWPSAGVMLVRSCNPQDESALERY